ncbi:MAG TPA: gliding motility protein GldM [Ferruginibacter sp.]|nr:gliding motility protein GldM [Ferruginibacter sp.]
MALPKEPRQKMINVMYLVLTALLALNVSAEVIDAFKTVDSSLVSSNNNLDNANATIFKSFEAKKADAATRAKAEEWGVIANGAKQHAKVMFDHLEDLKKQLKTASGLKVDEQGNPILKENPVSKKMEEDFKLDELNASSRLMDTEGKGKELDAKLKEFKNKMLNLHPEVKAAFEKTFPVELDPNKDNVTASFRMMPTVASITLLSKFQNNVKNAENQIVTFAHNKIGEVAVRFDKTGVLLGQSSNYVMPGQELVITAGIGAYSSAAQPQITIGGAAQQVVDGQATYKVTASGAGQRKVPVTIKYKDQDGNEKTETKEVEYVVGTPGGAAVMLDKMNVFYIGVDNPVTIGSPTGWDKTQVSMTGGTITGTGSNRTVRVSTVGKATITVTADKKPTNFEFRVKRIPNPVFKVGPGGNRMPSVTFKNQQFCRAELENFDFDLKYNVVSATVYFSGAGFPNVTPRTINSNSLASLSDLMQKCQPGTTITFDNVKVSGPDGTRTIDGNGILLY